MKISRVKHVIITSIIFLIIIAVIVLAFTSTIDMMKEGNVEKFNRVVAIEDIEKGELVTADKVETLEIAGLLNEGNMIYREMKEDDETKDSVADTNTVKDALNKEEKNRTDEEKSLINAPLDELWAVGKVAKEKIYKGEILINDKLVMPDDMVADETRLYAIPFESSNTGGYNIDLNEQVDICVLYGDSDKTISEYQTLPENKVIDIVLAGKQIADIRDESGNSRKYQDESEEEIVPGYLCFNLTYEEINKLEVAKRQGTLFVGKPENYYKEGSQNETFMAGSQMPSF